MIDQILLRLIVTITKYGYVEMGGLERVFCEFLDSVGYCCS